MRKQNETAIEYLNRLRKERGEAASRDAIRSYGQEKKSKGNVVDQGSN